MRTLLGCLIVAIFVVSALVAIHREDDPEPPASVVHVVDARGDVEWSAPTTTTSAPPPTTTVAPKPAARARTAPIVTAATWDDVADCESGGRWDDTRGGYEGGVHFLHSTWIAAGGRQFAEHAYQATRAQQIAIADAWRRLTDWRQWPACSRKLGLR